MPSLSKLCLLIEYSRIGKILKNERDSQNVLNIRVDYKFLLYNPALKSCSSSSSSSYTTARSPHRPSSEDDWQFANGDLIPATGVMAFGKVQLSHFTLSPFPPSLCSDAAFSHLITIPFRQHLCVTTTLSSSISRCEMPRWSAGRK